MVDTNSAEPAEGQGINIIALLQVVLKRKLLVVSICTGTAILSGVYSLTLPNIYAATVKVLPPQKESAGLSTMLGQMGGIAGMAAAKGSENELYLSLLKSRTLESAVIERLDLAKRYGTRSFLETWTRLDAAVKPAAGRDGIISITVEDTQPTRAALVANTMADELGRILVRLNISKVGSERLFLEKRLQVVRKDLTAAEESLKEFAQKNRITQVEAQAGASVASISRLKGDLDNKQVQLAALRSYQSDESFEVKQLQTAIKRLQESLARVAGRGSQKDGIPSIGEVPGLGLEYSRRLRDLKTQEVLYEQLTKQYEMAKLNEAKDASSLQILDEAVVPELKCRPRRSSIVLMATLISFISSLVLVYLLDYLERIPDDEREALRALRREALRLR